MPSSAETTHRSRGVVSLRTLGRLRGPPRREATRLELHRSFGLPQLRVVSANAIFSDDGVFEGGLVVLCRPASAAHDSSAAPLRIGQ